MDSFLKWLPCSRRPVTRTVLQQIDVFDEGEPMKSDVSRRAITLVFGLVALCTLIYSTDIVAASNRPATDATYRVAMSTVLDREDAKLVKIRVDSGAAFYATVDHGEGHTSSASTLERTSNLHHVEIVLLLDHVPSRKCVKELLTIGKAGGPSVQPVSGEYKLNDNFAAKAINGTYEREQKIELLRWQGRPFTLFIGK